MKEPASEIADLLTDFGKRMYEAGRMAAHIEHHYAMGVVLRGLTPESAPDDEPSSLPIPRESPPSQAPLSPPLRPTPPTPHARPQEASGARAAALQDIIAVLPTLGPSTPKQLQQRLAERGLEYPLHTVHNAVQAGKARGQLRAEEGRYSVVPVGGPPLPMVARTRKGRILPAVMALLAAREPQTVGELVVGLLNAGEKFTEDTLRHLLSHGVEASILERTGVGEYQRTARVKAAVTGEPPITGEEPQSVPHLGTELVPPDEGD